MIERSSARRIDERIDDRVAPVSETAVLEFRGRRHVVRMGNVSASGAMVSFALMPNIGEMVVLQLLDQGLVRAQVRWVKDGRIGLAFTNDGGAPC
ncbi:MAG: PilZ domain-containing protein [Sphingomicrobium sp.]